ncbi:hypothetical protein F8388_020650 [Cannabis sativa]|uniref:beta-aspartyl-peptidase n=1 Tax=Cannabis sativa TaxID=3483 RepID=A0A7J6F2S7_CANSA|nr:hypothetical protein F8388_020650 [Cannabis sativa]
MVVSTWPFVEAVRTAWRAVDSGFSAVDAVVEGCSACEELRCDGTVGPGGSPDENGETTIDALVMDGVTMEVGAVAAMRYVKDGIKAASCGPYHGKKDYSHRTCFEASLLPEKFKSSLPRVGVNNHDTISMAVIDKLGHIAVGTSTNGATFKIPGRVGDGPIPGSSSYADDEVGACGATGDGDIMMRFLPCYQVVESMRLGMEPKLAAKDAIRRIARKFPDFVGAVFAMNKNGVHAAACYGWTFQYSVRSPEMDDVKVFTVYPDSTINNK